MIDWSVIDIYDILEQESFIFSWCRLFFDAIVYRYTKILYYKNEKKLFS